MTKLKNVMKIIVNYDNGFRDFGLDSQEGQLEKRTFQNYVVSELISLLECIEIR